ncbi:unnamed protein product [Strongylus vulgaris]|uniref:Glutaredoxin domain-containing protein n=1 Tax=Strongylus vulgaris TaxID=40348 RepID=A0A3P7JDY0_STRVU|nr:unnamed protein product [Strongylus vulgaris]
MAVKAFVDKLLKTHKIVVFAKTYCPYSQKARAALESCNVKPGAMAWLDIDKRPDCTEIQDYLQALTGGRTVPRVFINQKFFGGGDDTAAAAKNGKLVQLLKELQAI